MAEMRKGWDKMKSNQKPSFKRALRISLIVIGLIILYAVGFSVTKVNLKETKSPTRQTQLVRIVRALFNPDLFTYDQVKTVVQLPIKIPCDIDPERIETPETEAGKPSLKISSNCLNAGDEILIEGFNFPNLRTEYVQFIPPTGVKINLGEGQTDRDGHFAVTAKIPKNRESEELQHIQVTTSSFGGNIRISETLKDTWNKIVETIFLALLSTTAGFIFALPLSFLAARNLMERVKTSYLAVSLILILFPIGFVAGSKFAALVNAQIVSWNLPPVALYSLAIAIGILCFVFLRRTFVGSSPGQQNKRKAIDFLRFIAAGITTIVFLYLFAAAVIRLGSYVSPKLGAFGFIGSFFADLGEILQIFIPLIIGLAVGFIFSSFAGKIAKLVLKQTSKNTSRLLSLLFSVGSAVMVFTIIMRILNWLYQFRNASIYTLYPAIAGIAVGLVISLLYRPDAEIKIGYVLYSITRTAFNILRSIESLVMVIVFVVWVGIGPFAGALALALHTVAALGKLYSEQVENILPGPLEAIQATGANLMQQIVYAVIPQIIPPYISFTLYRWDQNVRMSTIIGFAGGGGIGFLLQQNINLLNYRAASVQMIAIAIVVSMMDYLSGYVRNKIV